jgi:hypothetical protein
MVKEEEEEERDWEQEQHLLMMKDVDGGPALQKRTT